MPTVQPAHDGSVTPGLRVRVLVVDDDDTLRKGLRIALGEDGYEVLEAPDGLAALGILQAVSSPLIVLTDHVMPRLDGPGLLAAAARDPVLARRHVYLYMSGRTHPPSPDFAQVLAQLQVVRIRKPLKLVLLLEVIAGAAQRLPRPVPPVRVLVVDDDDTLRKGLRIALGEDGYEVLEAPDGLTALGILQAAAAPLVVLTDHVMPRLDGPGLLAAAARDPVLARRHVYLYMSGRTHPPSAELARVLDVLQVVRIRKPLKLAHLLEVIAGAAQRLPGQAQEGVTPL